MDSRKHDKIAKVFETVLGFDLDGPNAFLYWSNLSMLRNKSKKAVVTRSG